MSNEVPAAGVEASGPLRALIAEWREKAIGEATERGPGWVGAQSALDACADELDALLAAPVASAWQPIETAPKDGTRLLLARQPFLSGELIVVSGYWNSGTGHWATLMSMHEPTYWMPLSSVASNGGVFCACTCVVVTGGALAVNPSCPVHVRASAPVAWL